MSARGAHARAAGGGVRTGGRLSSTGLTGLVSTGVVLLVVLASSSAGPLTTAAVGCLIAVAVGIRPVASGSRRGLGQARTYAGTLEDTDPSNRLRLEPLASAVPLHIARSVALPRPAGGLGVRWWRRDGHDRLYVTGPAGASLGWLDRTTGMLHVMDERHRDAVEHALRGARTASDPPGA